MTTTNNTFGFTNTNFTFDNNYTFVRQGWQCPICGRVYSPDTMMCPYCGDNNTITTTITCNGGNIWRSEPDSFINVQFDDSKQQEAVKLFLESKNKKEIMSAMDYQFDEDSTTETNMTAFIKQMETDNRINELYDRLIHDRNQGKTE